MTGVFVGTTAASAPLVVRLRVRFPPWTDRLVGVLVLFGGIAAICSEIEKSWGYNREKGNEVFFIKFMKENF